MRTTAKLAAALAIAALGAPAAQAQPPDMHASTAQALAAQQDLRSPDARDAALHPRPVHEARQTPPGMPTWPAHPKPLAPPHQVKAGDSGSGVDWAPIAIGGGITVVLIGGLGAVSMRRVRRPARSRATA
jgi:hypothetical protein